MQGFPRCPRFRSPSDQPALSLANSTHTSGFECLLPGRIDLTGVFDASTKRWGSDMIGCVNTAAYLGLRLPLEAVALACWPDEQVGAAPSLQYCQRVVLANVEALWSKRDRTLLNAAPNLQGARHSLCRNLPAVLDGSAEV